RRASRERRRYWVKPWLPCWLGARTIRLDAVQIKPNRLALDAGRECDVMIRLVLYFVGMAHQFLPQRPWIRSDDVTKRLVTSVKRYGIGRLWRSHHHADTGGRFTAKQRQFLGYALTINNVQMCSHG